MNLVIVESPTKAKKLKHFLGSEYQVEASVGHIRDLPKTGLGVDVEHDFEPTYEVSENKVKVVTKLKQAASHAEKIYLATDPDREGEAIAWHIKYLLEEGKGKKKTNAEFFRATFHEITKSAVLKAIEHPSKINKDLVDAQQARRVLDRLVGYKVSPVLWKKIRRGLSAGRVQSVALRLVVEREREIEAFKAEEYWELTTALSTKQDKRKVFSKEGKLDDDLPEHIFAGLVSQVNSKKFTPTKQADVEPVLAVLPTAEYVVNLVEKKERNRSSLPPFTTSTLQQKAATSFGYSGKQTMQIAQQLYEEGLITYHRTDSVTLSQTAIEMAREYIGSQFGQQYLPEKPRVFAKQSKNAQEAHEAIRVTDIGVTHKDIQGKSSRFSTQHAKLYELIWKRFIASQMETAIYDQTSVDVVFTPKEVKNSIKQGIIKITGSVLKFDGWMRLFPNREDSLIPELTKGQQVHFTDLFAAQKFTQPPARYNDASLIKELEKRGIGRPSTYASIISVIIDRGYIERTQKKFFATPVGMTVTDFLLKYFEQIMDYEFTAEMEEDLDRISLGKKKWKDIVGTFYGPLEKKIETVTDKAERTQIPVEKTGEKCPTCGDTEHGEIVIRTGRFGKFKSCSRFPECKYTENIVEIVEDVVCPLCGKGEVTIKNTRWGKPFFGCSTYPTCNWASWKKPEKGEKITQSQWDELQKKREERKQKWLESRKGSGEARKVVTTKKKRAKKSK
ncbi:MAG: DNA topoisomerase 1 [Patescibacteria group bacterium]|nr:MAG: DNA topoisomerase 1 [Patescibacteria group bacterium]